MGDVAIDQARLYVQQQWRNNHSHFFAVHQKENQKFIGTAKINFVNRAKKDADIADIGIMIGERKCWGMGLASDVLHLREI